MIQAVTSAPPRAGKPFRLTGWHVLAIMVGFFAVVIAIDASFAVLAVKSFPGEVSKTPYEDGLKFNKVLAAREAQTELGWSAKVETGAPGVVALRFVDRAGKPLEGLIVSGVLERPATASGETRILFRQTAPGRYEGAAPVGKGAWDLTVSARSAKGEAFEAESRLNWR